jgi:exportin-1
MKYEDTPEIGKAFFILVESLVKGGSFLPFIFANPQLFDLIYNSVLYGLVCGREVPETCLSIIKNVYASAYTMKYYLFFQRYMGSTIENLLGVMFDKDKSYLFRQQCEVLSDVIGVEVPGVGDGKGFISNLISSSFPNISKESVDVFVTGLYHLRGCLDVFSEHIQDFRIKICEYTGDEDVNEEIELEKERSRMVQEKRVGQ